MIQEAFALKQVRRLSGMSFFPSDTVAVRELVTALRDVAKDEEIAELAVDHFLATATECPKPCQLRERAGGPETAEPEWVKPVHWNTGKLCPECQSWGRVVRDGKHERCGCYNGQAYPQILLDIANTPGHGVTADRGLRRIQNIVQADMVLSDKRSGSDNFQPRRSGKKWQATREEVDATVRRAVLDRGGV